MRRTLLVLVPVILFQLAMHAQNFVNVSQVVGVDVLSNTYNWGTGLSFFDVDEDGFDDITLGMSGSPTRLYRNLGNNSFQLTATFFNTDEVKSCLWFDMDEDGDNDILITRMLTPIQLFRNDGAWNFTDVSDHINYNFIANNYTWGASVGDPNRDGYADIVVSNYGLAGSANHLLINQGNGFFEEDNSTPISLFERMTFQTTWIDLNEDGWQDIFAVNDHNQINEFYLNQGDSGGFADAGTATGLGFACDGMNTAWADYDLDGDLDVYVTDVYTGNHLMQNNGSNQFVDVASSAGVSLLQWSWGAVWIDYDNNGYQDLYVCVKDLGGGVFESKLFVNNGNGTFSLGVIPSMGVVRNAFAAAQGDFNNDGKPDLLVSPEATRKMALLMNTSPSTGNFCKIRFKGKFSTRNAIGTRYEAYVSGREYVGQIFYGDAYLAQQSQNKLIGIGSDTQIDSLVVHWISGLNETFYSIPSGQLQIIQEGSSLSQEIWKSKELLCATNADSLQVSFNSNFARIIWDNLISGNSATINSSGNHSVSYSAPYGHWATLNYEIEHIPLPVKSQFIVPPACYGGNNGYIGLTLYNNLGEFSSQTELSDLTAGTYPIQLNYGNACVFFDTLTILEPEPLQVAVDVVGVSCFGNSDGMLSIQVAGGTLPYSFSSSNSNLVLSELVAGDYEGVISDANGCYVTWQVAVPSVEPILLMVDAPSYACAYDTPFAQVAASGGTGNFTWQGIGENGILQFGENLLVATDANGCSKDTVVTILPITPPMVSVTSTPSSVLGLGDITLAVQGDFGPYAVNWSTGDTTLALTNLTDGLYTYVLTDSMQCHYAGDVQVLFDAILEQQASTMQWITTDIGIRYRGNAILQNVRLFDVSGRLIHLEAVVNSGHEIHLPSTGIYLIQCGNQSQRVMWYPQGN